jgi:cell division protein FtsL
MSYADSRYSHNMGYSYNNTSEAYDMSYADMPEPTPITKVRHIIRKKYIKAKEPMPVSIVRTFLTIVVVFALSLATLAIYAQNSSQKDELVNMQEQVATLEESNKYLEESINESLDLKKIEKEALLLGLQKPAEYQTVSISVPKESYTVQYGDSSETSNTLLDTIKNLFKGLR